MHILSRIAYVPNFISRSVPVFDPPIADPPEPNSGTQFSLDFSGVAGFFGGDGAVCAMATVHLLPFRSLMGWYNSPGSYEIAKQYGQIANSRLWDGLFPGSKCEPAELFGLDGKDGPRRFLGAHSGTSLPTGHAAYLLSRTVQDPDIRPECLARGATESTPVHVTVVRLRDNPSDQTEIFLNAKTRSNNPALSLSHSWILAILPITASIGACVVCALIADWYCFASIALGIVAGGVACKIIGSGELTFHHPRVPGSAPIGDGIMWEGTEVIVLLGPEHTVNVFTRGGFSLRFGGGSKHDFVGWCSVLLTLQFLVQLLLIPQGRLFGQIMFVASLAVSWMYNMYVSSFDREGLQMDLLLRQLMPDLGKDIVDRLSPGVTSKYIERYRFPSWRTAVVFTQLELERSRPVPNLRKTLDEMLPNDTPVWQEWKKLVIKLVKGETISEVERTGRAHFPDGSEELQLFTELFYDAETVHRDWKKTPKRVASANNPHGPTAILNVASVIPRSVQDAAMAAAAMAATKVINSTASGTPVPADAVATAAAAAAVGTITALFLGTPRLSSSVSSSTTVAPPPLAHPAAPASFSTIASTPPNTGSFSSPPAVVSTSPAAAVTTLASPAAGSTPPTPPAGSAPSPAISSPLTPGSLPLGNPTAPGSTPPAATPSNLHLNLPPFAP